MIFQNYFCGWLAEYNDSIELIYVGGLRNFQCKQIVKSSGEAVIVEELSGGQQEEADERMMLHVNHAEKKGVESVLVCSKDTDVFVSLPARDIPRYKRTLCDDGRKKIHPEDSSPPFT